MQPSKTPHKKKFRLLLDAAFPIPSQLPKLATKAHLEHVVYTLHMSRQTEDKHIYQKATQENCCVVTIDGDFKKLVKPKGAGVIMIPPDLSVKQIEEMLLKFISKKSPEDIKGKVEKATKD